LLHGVSYRAIAKQYGVAIAGLSRHVAEHIQGPLRRIIQAEASLTQDAQTVQPTLLEMRRLNQRYLRILAIAEDSKDHDAALGAIRECRRNLELIARLSGELDPHAMGEAGGQGLVVKVVYTSSTKSVVADAPKVLEAMPVTPECPHVGTIEPPESHSSILPRK
jgi:hypothetical protein